MKPTAKRGLIRLAVVLMIGWNLLTVWTWSTSNNESRGQTISIYRGVQSDCMKTRPHAECRAEYEKLTEGYSQWNAFKAEFTLLNIAVIEFFPPIAIGLVWLLVWSFISTVKWILRGFGVELRKQTEPVEPVPALERVSAVGHRLISPRNILALSVGIVALAISYYFLVSLPATNRERLQFEKDKAEAARTERDKKEEAAKQAVADRKMVFQRCDAYADSTYWSYVKLNSKEIPGKPGAYSAPMYVWTAADKRKSDALAECHRQLDK